MGDNTYRYRYIAIYIFEMASLQPLLQYYRVWLAIVQQKTPFSRASMAWVALLRWVWFHMTVRNSQKVKPTTIRKAKTSAKAKTKLSSKSKSLVLDQLPVTRHSVMTVTRFGRLFGAICAIVLLLYGSLSHAYVAYTECDPNSQICDVGHPNVLNGTLRVALAQVSSNSTTTLEQNAAKHAEWVQRAATEGARVVLFPELSMTGYFTQSVANLALNTSFQIANERLRNAEDVVAAACKRNNIYAIIGIPVFIANITQENPRPWYNTALVIGPSGTKEYRQAKLYPCCSQDGQAGEWLDIFNITNFDGTTIPVATQICFDDFHPEIVRLQSMSGAQVLFYMSWESDVSMEMKLSLGDKLGSAQAVVPAHAAMNQLYIIQVNAGALVDNMITEWNTGYDGGPVTGGSHGQSRVVDPSGRVLEQGRVFGQQLLIHDLDLTLCFGAKQRMGLAGLTSKLFSKMWAEGMKTVGNRMKIDW